MEPNGISPVSPLLPSQAPKEAIDEGLPASVGEATPPDTVARNAAQVADNPDVPTANRVVARAVLTAQDRSFFAKVKSEFESSIATTVVGYGEALGGIGCALMYLATRLIHLVEIGICLGVAPGFIFGISGAALFGFASAFSAAGSALVALGSKGQGRLQLDPQIILKDEIQHSIESLSSGDEKPKTIEKPQTSRKKVEWALNTKENEKLKNVREHIALHHEGISYDDLRKNFKVGVWSEFDIDLFDKILDNLIASDEISEADDAGKPIFIPKERPHSITSKPEISVSEDEDDLPQPLQNQAYYRFLHKEADVANYMKFNANQPFCAKDLAADLGLDEDLVDDILEDLQSKRLIYVSPTTPHDISNPPPLYYYYFEPDSVDKNRQSI